MIICIGNALNTSELDSVSQSLRKTKFVDGRATAGWHAALVKRNTQSEPSRTLQSLVLKALERNPVFQLAARPRAIRPPLFSRYEPGMEYGLHVDDAIMTGASPLRTDVAFTLFLNPPSSYEGGELIMDTAGGEQSYKLDAGSMIVYPASTLHRVAPVTAGERLACVSWAQSFVRDPARRELLFDLETARRNLFEREGKNAEFDLLSKSVSNLLRMWADI